MSYEGKTTVVTGAGGGIGRAIALELARQGASVAALDLDEAGAQATARAIEEAGGTSMVVACDVSLRDKVQASVATVLGRLGRIDVLVNCAGVGGGMPTGSLTEEYVSGMLAVNLEGPLWTCQAVSAHMADRGSGSIVNIASDAGLIGASGASVYSASKGGVVSLTKSLAKELAKDGVTGQMRLSRPHGGADVPAPRPAGP